VRKQGAEGNICTQDRRLRKLHNEELHNLHSLPNIIMTVKSRRTRWAKHATHMGKIRHEYRNLVAKLEGMTPLGRPWRRWEGNIKIDHNEIG
jgi:hypothetical protein